MIKITIWKFARLAETGEPVDEETLYKRTEARNYIRENENTIYYTGFGRIVLLWQLSSRQHAGFCASKSRT